MTFIRDLETSASRETLTESLHIGGINAEDASILRAIIKHNSHQHGDQVNGSTALEKAFEMDKVLADREREFAQRASIDRTLTRYYDEINTSAWYRLEPGLSKNELKDFLTNKQDLNAQEKRDLTVAIQRFEEIAQTDVDGKPNHTISASNLHNFAQGKLMVYDGREGWTAYDDKSIPGNALPDAFWRNAYQKK